MTAGGRQMRRLKMTEEHRKKLQEFNLQDLPEQYYSPVCYAAGEKITQEGTPLQHLAIVVRGKAKIHRTAPNGKSLILSSYLSDGMIGEIELLTHQELANATVTAISDFECVLLDFGSCVRELQTNIPFLNRLGTMVAEKLNEVDDNYAMTALCTAEERLCRYICRNEQGGMFSDVYTETACSIGTSYRHLYRMLGQLCTDGILRKTEQGYQITDREQLFRRSQLQEQTPDDRHRISDDRHRTSDDRYRQ